MANFHNTVPPKCLAGLSSDQKKRLFEAGCLYLLGKESTFAYLCFEEISERTVEVLFNKALCCYLVEWYEECYNLLQEAESLLSIKSISQQVHIPNSFDRCTKQDDLHLCPMPLDAPQAVITMQVLYLKADVAFHLRLFEEVRRIIGIFQKPCCRINNLLDKIKDDNNA